MTRYFFNASTQSETEQPCDQHDLVFVASPLGPKQLFVWETCNTWILFRSASDCLAYYR